MYPHDLILVLILVYWMFRKPKEKINFTLFTPLQVFLLVALVSLAVNSFTQPFNAFLEGLAYCLRFFLYSGLYFGVSWERKIRWEFYLYATGVVFSLLGILQYILYPNLRNLSYLGWDPHYYRLFSTFLDPNFAGLFIVITFFLGLYIYRIVKKKYWIIFSQLLLIIALILTLSRSSWLAFLVPLVWLIWKKRVWKFFIGTGIFVILLFFLPLPYRQITPIFRQETALARFDNWMYSIELVKQKPVFGYGFNLLRSIQESGVVGDDTQRSHAGAGVDNSFLFVLVTTGIIGGTAWIYLLVSMGKMGIYLMRSKKHAMLGETYVLTLSAICIHSLFVNSFFYPWIMIWMWILAGVVEQKNRSRNSTK
jgi:O-antigen ligase